MTPTYAQTELLEALQERGHTIKEIDAMTPAQRFDEYCQWHGLIGWGPKLRDIMEAAGTGTTAPQDQTP